MAWFLVQGIPAGDPGGQPQPPLGIWGPNDPRPTNPIAGWNPGTGTFPPGGGMPPLGIWGPNDPRPTNPIAGWNPGTGTFPQPPGIWGPPGPWPSPPIVMPIPPDTPGWPPEGGSVAIIPAGTTLISTADIEIPNPADPENPFKIPAGTTIVTSQAILVPTGYEPPTGSGRPPNVVTPVKEK